LLLREVFVGFLAGQLAQRAVDDVPYKKFGSTDGEYCDCGCRELVSEICPRGE
jgi:hypothetical protein